MPELKLAFEAAGFTDVKTVLSSGNVVFTSRRASESFLQAKAEAAMRKRLGREFLTIIRSVDDLRELLASDPYREFPPRNAKRVVTFLRDAPATHMTLPIELDGARILHVRGGGRDVLVDYLPSPKGPVFMTLIEKTFGKATTTRTWDTISKVAR